MVVKRVGVLSLAKILGLFYGSIGLVAGIVFAVLALFGVAIGVAADESLAPLAGLLFGAGAVVILPLFYGALGFLVGLLGGWVFNLACRVTGGLELDVVSPPVA